MLWLVLSRDILTRLGILGIYCLICLGSRCLNREIDNIMKSTKEFYRSAYKEILQQRIVCCLLLGITIGMGMYVQNRDKELCALLNHRRDWLQDVEHRTNLAHGAIIQEQYARQDYEAYVNTQVQRLVKTYYRKPWKTLTGG